MVRHRLAGAEYLSPRPWRGRECGVGASRRRVPGWRCRAGGNDRRTPAPLADGRARLRFLGTGSRGTWNLGVATGGRADTMAAVGRRSVETPSGITWLNGTPMTLREFVADTLTQIVAGVGDARGKNRQVAPTVVQSSQGSGYVMMRSGATNPGAFLVEFDVAVTISKKTNVEVESGAKVLVLEAGGSRASSAEHSTVSRIKFEVPVAYDKVV